MATQNFLGLELVPYQFAHMTVPCVPQPVPLGGSVAGRPDRPAAGPLWALLSLVKDSFKSCEVTCR